MKLFDDKICHLTFSHTDCIDIWPAYFGEMKKYFDCGIEHFVCVDKVIDEIPSYIKPLVYTNGETYSKRLLDCLNMLSENYEYIIFDHEDMFLYDYPVSEELEKYYKVLKSGELDHIRLIKGGSCISEPFQDIPTLHKFNLESKWIFSIQPSFWKIETFKELLSKHIDDNVWDLERKGQITVKQMELQAAYSFNAGGKRRGIYHFDNIIYPYVATAIGKGKWNYNEYKKELGKVFELYSINPKKRGINSFLDGVFDNFSFLKKGK